MRKASFDLKYMTGQGHRRATRPTHAGDKLPCMRAAVLLLALAVHAFSAPRELDDLLDRARALPPEFASDLILSVAGDSAQPLTPKEKIALVEEAFRLAASSQMPYPVMGQGYHTDTPAGALGEASRTGLNSLTLQSRGIEAMAKLDKTRLRTLFTDLRPIKIQRQSCLDIMRPKLDHWAQALLLVAKESFNTQERAKNLDLIWLDEQIRLITSPMHLLALSSTMRSADPRLRDRVHEGLASMLPHIEGDWIAFEYSQHQIPITRATASSAREYILRHVRGPRCGTRRGFDKPLSVPTSVIAYNKFVNDEFELKLSPIDLERLEPSRMEESYKTADWWKSDKSKQVLNELKWLNHGNRNLPDNQRFWTVEERKSVEWNERYGGLLKLIEGWKDSDEPTSADYFHMRVQTHYLLGTLVPPGPQQRNEFRNFISFMNQSFNTEGILHAEWFAATRNLLRNSSTDPAALDDMEQFGNTVLSTYARALKRKSTKP